MSARSAHSMLPEATDRHGLYIQQCDDDLKPIRCANCTDVQLPAPVDASSAFQKSIPTACAGTSTVATVFREWRSITSTVPGSEPMPSTATNAKRLSGLMTTPSGILRLVGKRANSRPELRSNTETDWARLL